MRILRSLLGNLRLWEWVVGVVAAVCWALGALGGWRAVLLLLDRDPGRGLVARAQAFGEAATVWWVPASVLTLAVVLLVVGSAVLGHLSGGVGETQAEVGGEEGHVHVGP